MLSVVARPRFAALAPFIASFHYHESDFPPGLERILPNGQAHLMVNLGEDQFRTYSGPLCQSISHTRGAVLAGPHTRATVLDTLEQRWLVAVQFRPGGAAPFFSLPMCELSDQVVEIDQLWCGDGGTLRERLLEASTPHAIFRLLEEALLQHLATRHDPAISLALSALERGVSIAVIRERLGLLPKTFVRRFSNQVGMPPKRFARVRRMQRVVRSLWQAVDWSSVAAQLGYTDQAHLIHDFRDLTGVTPAACRPHSPQRSNHLPIAVSPDSSDPFLQYGAAPVR